MRVASTCEDREGGMDSDCLTEVTVGSDWEGEGKQ